MRSLSKQEALKSMEFKTEDKSMASKIIVPKQTVKHKNP